jgi:predicted metal-dependent HD superfamily phosphohydrolase
MNRDELVAAYTAQGRHYHNLAHIEDCLGALARVDNLSAAEREILVEAIWWHDVVYDATRADNEELSARLAEAHVRADISREVGRLIRLTRTHQVLPDDRLGAVLISIDLSILGAEPSRCRSDPAGIHSCPGSRLSCRSRQGARPVCRPAGHLSGCKFCRDLRPAGPRKPRA